MTHEISNMVASDIMVTRLVKLRPETDVFKAIEILVKNRISGAPVVDDQDQLLGVFSEKCCMQVLVDAAYEGLPTNQVQAFMDKDPDTVSENTQLISIANFFLITPSRRLPVLRDGRIVGQISRRDVIRAAAKRQAKHSDHSKRLLYLSALREMDDVPAV
ncbi:CBS domain-containing protein [Mariniblastus fucicola]|uniref:Inosine 5'-monophosphate dehydrogenase n=1 Tax=Mariniblastus fucicola TaxID=980251 RepID=A0A5B9PEQ7_9BACT|nr:CBS domain-containing protein [Mariniblastus fucicola]QEG24009.1 inosine 5'-monophosphate dehydrogenase [Mariniblastus fucicola]